MNDKLEPDFIGNLRLLSTKEWGLANSLVLPKVGCIFTYDGDDFSCFALIPQGRKIAPGVTTDLSFKLIYPDRIKVSLKVGNPFTLKDYRVFAEGTILEIL